MCATIILHHWSLSLTVNCLIPFSSFPPSLHVVPLQILQGRFLPQKHPYWMESTYQQGEGAMLQWCKTAEKWHVERRYSNIVECLSVYWLHVRFRANTVRSTYVKYSLFFQFWEFLEWKLKLVIASLLYWGVVTKGFLFRASHPRRSTTPECELFSIWGKWMVCVVINVCLSYVARL